MPMNGVQYVAVMLLIAPALGATAADAVFEKCTDNNVPGPARVDACTESIAHADDPHTRFRAYANRAQAYSSMARGDLWPADMARAIALEPDNMAAYRLRAAMYSDDNQYSEAVADLDVFLAKNPDDIEARNLRAYAHAALHHYKTAIADYDAIVRLRPDDAETLYNRGIAHRQQRNFVRARADFERAIALDQSLSADFPAACFDVVVPFTGAKRVLKNWPACERAKH